MASNSFGNIFRITTWGESHGKAIGVVIDGCPAGLEIAEDEINHELSLRAPGQSIHTSPRKETDICEILSGVYEGKTTGSPLSIIIWNKDVMSESYDPIKNLLRPGHANFTYLQKYGIFDYRGGGRASARETACRVAAGAVAKKFLKQYEIDVVAYLVQVADVKADVAYSTSLRKKIYGNPIYCPDHSSSEEMMKILHQVREAGDSVGGTVELVIQGLPPGLGDPIYEKLEAQLAKALLSIPATKGFEIGTGFGAAEMRGSEHNDVFTLDEQTIMTETNHAGGTLGGISTGMPLIARVAFKPTSSLKIPLKTMNLEGQKALFQLPETSRHDPCVAIRGVPVVEAMGALVVIDALLMNRCVRI
ncbi:MAG: chorismate synthase [Chlamydiales bacterium 38-26]|nr:MAG: chorismate synthase [Chlamydiales bacterium 38-26]